MARWPDGALSSQRHGIASGAHHCRRCDVRTCDLERAREAARTALSGVENLRPKPGAAAADPTRPPGMSRDAMLKAAKLAMWKLADEASKQWGEVWSIGEEEAESIAVPLIDVIEFEFGTMQQDPWSRLYLALGFYAIPRMLVNVLGGQAPQAPSSTVDTTATVKKEPQA